MRISDWSSDVCSSDLQFVLGCRLAGSGGRRIDHLDIDAVRPGERFLEAGAQRSEAVEADAGGQRRLQRRGERVGIEGRADGEAQRLLHLAQEAGRLRSEEHTSELQSLMRTSYAGFCLK